MLEAFFDSEIDLTDSFYVSFKLDVGDSLSTDITYIWIEDHYPACDTFVFPLQNFRYIESKPTPDDPWIFRQMYMYPMIWPIIRRDCDTCPTVQGLQAFQANATQQFFRWQRGEGHRDWQFSYGPVGTSPDDGIILDVIQPMSGIIDFDPDTQYVVYVRARCLFARVEYGPWSAPLYVNQNNDGIDGAVAEQFSLSPNPASGVVTVSAEAGIRHVEVYDARGAMVSSTACDGQPTATIETQSWPAGQYIVSVETPAGLATKVLTVRR